MTAHDDAQRELDEDRAAVELAREESSRIEAALRESQRVSRVFLPRVRRVRPLR
jgi:hypothetical protein